MTDIFQDSFEHAPIGICHTAGDGTFLQVNRRFADMLGYSVEGLYRRRLPEITHPEDVETDVNQTARLVSGELDGYAVEKRLLCRDGSVLHGEMKVSLSPPNHGGSRYFIIALTDGTVCRRETTRLRTALAEKDGQFREIYSRFKNVMQMVISLVRLQEDTVTDGVVADALASLRKRIMALSLIHESLDREDPLSPIDLNACFSMIGSEALHAAGITDGRVRVRVDVPPFQLSFSDAQALVVIVNELVTNAVSHAFPSGREGDVTIRMRMSDGAAVTLTVGDDGPEIPESMDWRQAPGLGLRLVQAVVETQFNSAVNLERSNGNHFSLVFELPETSAALQPQNN